MKRDIFKLTISELREWFRRESRLFLRDLDEGASLEDLQRRKDMIRNISLLIDEKSPEAKDLQNRWQQRNNAL